MGYQSALEAAGATVHVYEQAKRDGVTLGPISGVR